MKGQPNEGADAQTEQDGKVFALIFAGGVGSRMGDAKVPKQFLELGGKPIIAYTIDHFEDHEEVDAIVVVCIEEGIPLLEEIVAKNGYRKITAIVPGGGSGQQSIFNGLQALADSCRSSQRDIVLVHDGVRPLIDAAAISDCIASVREKGCTAVVAPAIETVIEVEGAKTVGILDRSKARLARAPQGFFLDQLYGAHLESQRLGLDEFIDSISMMAHFGHPISVVDGPAENIKITTRQDYFAFKGYMDYRELGQLW